MRKAKKATFGFRHLGPPDFGFFVAKKAKKPKKAKKVKTGFRHLGPPDFGLFATKKAKKPKKSEIRTQTFLTPDF